jgi:hypothetical protein
MSGNGDLVVEEMVNVINGTLWHNQSGLSLDDLPQATPEQKALYWFLMERAENHRAVFDEARFTSYAGWKEYLQSLDALIHLRAKARRRRLFSRQNITLKHSEIFGL